MAESVYTYRTTGRNRATLAAFALVWGVIFLLWLTVDAHPLVLGVVGLVSIPAALDLIRAPEARFWLTDETLGFSIPGQSATLRFEEIERVTADTRLDLSTRLTAWLTTGEKVRIPPHATPPRAPFLAAASTVPLKVMRRHFILWG
ncbi:MAG: hypothetical protein ACU0CI_09350 [Shimia sp.]